MNYLSKNKKVMWGILIIIIMISICYYIYSENTDFLSNQEQNLEIEEKELKDYSDAQVQNTGNEINEKSNIIKVHISGAVKQEGIVELRENDRIEDAIQKVGGLKDEACIDDINLAYILEDGMKIHIPTEEEQKEKQNKGETNENKSYITNTSGNIVENIKEEINNQNQVSKVNINTATQKELETLPGIGTSTALKIISYRNENGKFKSIEDIKEVSGIGENKFKNIKDLISI